MGGRASLIILMCFLWPLSLQGQSSESWSTGAAARATLFVGEGSDFLAGDYGVGIHGARRLRRGLAVRADLTYLNLHETSVAGERADNRLLGLGLGPDLSVGAGLVDVFLRPFARIVGNFRRGDGGAGPEGSAWTAAFGATGGLRVQFGRVSLELAGEIARMGELEFARVSTHTGPATEEDLGALSLELGFGVGIR